MLHLLIDRNVFKIISLFALSPGSRFSRKEMKERVRLHNVPLDGTLAVLRKAGVLQREGRLYALDFGSEEGKTLVQLAVRQYRSFRELPFDVYLLVTDLAAFLATAQVDVYVFGSYAKLVYRQDSDVDIAVLSTGTPDRQVTSLLAAKLEKTYHKRIEFHYFDRTRFTKNKKDPLVKEILKNGIRIL